MTIRSRTTLKTYFETGDKPSATQFSDLIDSCYNKTDDTLTSGTVTSIIAGTGLTGGTITSAGTIAVDYGTTANKIVRLDASAKLPAVDGSQLTGITPGALTLLATTTANGASSVSFGSSYITSTYNNYILLIDNIYAGTTGDLFLSISTNNGSSYVNSAYYYCGQYHQGGTTMLNTYFGSNDSSFNITGSGALPSSGGYPQGQLQLWFSNPSTTAYTNFSWSGFVYNYRTLGGGGNTLSASPINNIKIAHSLGSTITGNFKLYGVS